MHIFALPFTKSSPQISRCELLDCLFYSPCGFCKHGVRRKTKPLSNGTRVYKITITRKQVYIHLSTCPVRLEMKGPPFKTTTLHRPFNYGQASASRTRPESRQKGERSYRWFFTGRRSRRFRVRQSGQLMPWETEKKMMRARFNKKYEWISKLWNIGYIFCKLMSFLLFRIKPVRAKCFRFLKSQRSIAYDLSNSTWPNSHP